MLSIDDAGPSLINRRIVRVTAKLRRGATSGTIVDADDTTRFSGNFTLTDDNWLPGSDGVSLARGEPPVGAYSFLKTNV